MRGTDLASDVHARWPGIAVLLVSGHPPALVGVDAGRGWPPLLPKPFSREQLADAMSRSLAR
jgi:FixJ family two-component response regulator